MEIPVRITIIILLWISINLSRVGSKELSVRACSIAMEDVSIVKVDEFVKTFPVGGDKGDDIALIRHTEVGSSSRCKFLLDTFSEGVEANARGAKSPEVF